MGPRDGANFATCVVFLTFLMCRKRRKMTVGGGVQGLGGGSKGFGSGGVGGRGTGPRNGANFATCIVFLRPNWRFLKDPCGGGGGYAPELAWWTGG